LAGAGTGNNSTAAQSAATATRPGSTPTASAPTHSTGA
jgi:hypothetical protein